MLEGLVFDIRRFSIHDGPGIRTTVFFKGCPLTCAWCHNPESQAAVPELLYRSDRCLVCGSCAEVCPERAIAASRDLLLTNSETCRLCGSCTEACPAEARELVGRRMSLADLIEIIRRDEIFYDESGGGITVSGGEPLMQPGFLLALLKACRDLGIHRAVDTSGLGDEQTLLEVAGETDLFLYDLKHMDPMKHQEFTGVSNSRILRNLKLLAETGSEICIRVPLVGGFNLDDDNMHSTARFVKSLSKICGISLLPFHDGAIDKHRRFGREYNSRTDEKVPPARIEDIEGIFTSYGLSVQIGG